MAGYEEQRWQTGEHKDYGKGGKYAYSIQILNLPNTWAKRGHITRVSLLSIAIVRHPKEGGKVYCYAIISVNSKEEGDSFINDIKNVVMDEEELKARWSSRAVPRTPSTPHRAHHNHSGEVRERHPVTGLRCQSTPQEEHRYHEATTQVERPSGLQEPPEGVSIMYTPEVHEQAAVAKEASL